jgi:hypothetical protein
LTRLGRDRLAYLADQLAAGARRYLRSRDQRQACAALQRDPIVVYGASRVPKVEDHAVLLMQSADEITDLLA